MVADVNILQQWGFGGFGILGEILLRQRRRALMGVPPPPLQLPACHLAGAQKGCHQPTQRPRSSSSIRGSLLARTTSGQFSLPSVRGNQIFHTAWSPAGWMNCLPSKFASKREMGKKTQGRNTARRQGVC